MTFQDPEKIVPIDEFSTWEKDQAIHSARYILEDVSFEAIAEASGLPLGVINAAFRNIFQGGLPEQRTHHPKLLINQEDYE